MKKLLRILLNPITWILVSLGILTARKAVAVALNTTIQPTAGDELPDDDVPI